jgi:host factor-I protein
MRGLLAPGPKYPQETTRDLSKSRKKAKILPMPDHPAKEAHDARTDHVSKALPNEKEKEMDKLAQNIQEAFLNNARKERVFLTIYLMSGVKLSGRIKSFDKYSVVLESNNQEQLIFKHAISTVVVSRSFHPLGFQGSSTPGTPHITEASTESDH